MSSRTPRRLGAAAALSLLSFAVFGCAARSPAFAPAEPPEPIPGNGTAEAKSGSEAPVATGTPRTADAVDLSLAAPIPFDPAVRRGRLDNGLEYYVRRNGKPENRVELRLVVDAGSVLEDEDQRGLAHFVEHMAFNGTRDFEKQELVDYLEGIGMRFGPDLNAYTSQDETVYILQVPTDDPETLETAFRILENWAHAIRFEGEEIDKERGVVLEEWRLGRGAGARLRDKQFPVIFEGSRYAERLTIGDPEIIENAPYEALRRFYRDWYRTDNMAVVAVGDIDPQKIVSWIETYFAPIEAPETPFERPDHPVPDHDETLVSVETDPEATATSVTVLFKRAPLPDGTVADFRRDLVASLYRGMLNARLDELTLAADPPFVYGYSGSGDWVRTKTMVQLAARVRDGGVLRGLDTLLTEARRVRVHGFNPSELERTKRDLLRRVEAFERERDKQQSTAFASDYVRHFLEGDPVPSVEQLVGLYRGLLPGITLDDVNRAASAWTTPRNRVVLVSAPESALDTLPTREELLAAFDAAGRRDVEPWVDRTRDEPLVAEPPEPGAIVEEDVVESVGLTRWTLSNGARVLLKPTDFQNDQVVLRGYSPGGTSTVDTGLALSERFASSLVSEMGLGTFDRVELQKALAGKVASAGAWIGSTAEGVRGSASPQDLKTMFELLWLRFTAPREDPQAFEAFKSNYRAYLENQAASPGYDFRKRLNAVLTSDHPRERFLELEDLERIDPDVALAFYRDRFADASDFVFTIVGNFEVDAIRPLVERWLGGLPSSGRREGPRDLGIRPMNGVVTFEVERGIEPKASVRMVFHGDADWSRRHAHVVGTMTAALRIRLREVLREDMGGVYGVGVSGSISRVPVERYSVSVGFGCDPERVDALIEAVWAEIRALAENGPDPDVLAKVREQQLRARETALERNGFWANVLEDTEVLGFDPGEILTYPDLVASVDAEEVRAAAARYFDETRYVLGVLLPEPDADDAPS